MWPFLPAQGQLGGTKVRPWDGVDGDRLLDLLPGGDENILGFGAIG